MNFDQGYIGPSADPQLKHGSVIWKIERGEGQFAEATGLITPNFFVSSEGEVTDNHFGIIFVQQAFGQTGGTALRTISR
jgi:hypothetical protein